MKHQPGAGFTIVELLIVIVVIAILASTTIVAYQGIQSRAADTAVKSAVQSWSQVLKAYYAQNEHYPDVDDDTVCLGSSFEASAPYAANECAKDDDGWSVKTDVALNASLADVASPPSTVLPTIKGSYYSGYDYFRGLAYYSMHDGEPETGFLYVLNGKKCLDGDVENYTYAAENVQCRHVLAQPE